MIVIEGSPRIVQQNNHEASIGGFYTSACSNLPSHSCHHGYHIHVALVDSHKKLDTGVLYSKKGGGVIDATCQSSNQNVV